MLSNLRYAVVGLTMLCVGCADREAPTWPAAAALEAVDVTGKSVSLQWPTATDDNLLVRYELSTNGHFDAEIPVEGEPALTVTGLAEFTEYTFAVTAVDEAGNVGGPLTLRQRTADTTAPVWTEGCELSVVEAEPGNLDAGLLVSWCEATDNNTLARFELRRGSDEAVTFAPDATTATRTDRPMDGRYVIAACDAHDNCAELPAVHVNVEMRAQMQASIASIELNASMFAGLLSGYSDTAVADILADTSWAEDAAMDSVMGLVAGEDYGGLGVAGWGGSGGADGGGGGAVGIGGLGMRGSPTYKPASASLKPGGQADLAAHVARRMSRIDHCYQQARAEDRQLKGSLTIRLTVDVEGSITVDGVSGPDSGGLTTCVTGSLRGRLAEPPAEAASGTFTVTLDPGSS